MCFRLTGGRSEEGFWCVTKDPSSAPLPQKCPARDHAAEASPEERFDLNACNKTAAAMMWCTPPSRNLDAGLSNRSVEHPNHHSDNQRLLSHLSMEKAVHRAPKS